MAGKHSENHNIVCNKGEEHLAILKAFIECIRIHQIWCQLPEGSEVVRHGVQQLWHGDLSITQRPASRLYLADDHCHCFACYACGDVIDFAANLFSLPLYEA